MTRYGLSKSRVASFEQCPKKAWLPVDRPEITQYDECAEMRFAGGNGENSTAAENSDERPRLSF